jgi:pyrroline-5-carboxylate reductase
MKNVVVMSNSGRIVIIGGGNMGAAFAYGLLRQAIVTSDKLLVIEPDDATRAKLQQNSGDTIRTLPKFEGELTGQDLLLLAVKPQIAVAVCSPLVSQVAADTVIVSLMAGFSLASLSSLFSQNTTLVRAMPNLPARLGRGVTAYFVRSSAAPGEHPLLHPVLAAVGTALEVDSEEKVDVATAISGSGPGYIFYFVEAMTEAAEELGMSAAQARVLVEETLHGGSALLQDSQETASELRSQVTSAGGTTAAAIASFDKSDLKSVILAGMRAAYDRARELSD